MSNPAEANYDPGQGCMQPTKTGLYRLFWHDGGDSLAAVGVTSDGRMWFAPTNWVSVPWFDWTMVRAWEHLTP